MNDADVLFPWEREGGERDAGAPDGTGSPRDPDRSGAAPRADDAAPAADPAETEASASDPAEAGADDVEQAGHEPATAGADDAGEPARGEPATADAAVAGAADADDEARFALLDTEYARKAAERASAALREKPIAQKEYYSISEVCELVGLKPHVLRYWETQFQVLNPSKNRSGNRVYQRKEIRLIVLVKHLLYEEKYTVEGAKAKLDRLRREGELADTAGVVLDRSMLEQLRADLSELTTLLTPPARS